MHSLSISCPSCRAAVPAASDVCPNCRAALPPTEAERTNALETAARARGETDSGTALTPVGANPYPFLAAPRQRDELGRLGPYRVLSLLGQGGMGVVFRAEDPSLRRHVALKVMLPGFATDPAAKARFLREARAQAAVEHDHVAVIHQVGEDGDVPFIALPLLKGLTLADALKANPRVPVPEAVRIAREVAEGLAAAHEQGLVHRDIKPGNVWLEGRRLRVKILDFGLARPAGAGGNDDGHPVTEQGAVVGTPAYMSPEQARGDALDPRTDLFSLGTMLYQMLTGRLPFLAGNTTGTLIAVATETPPAPRSLNPVLSPELDALVLRLLEKNPAGRPPTADAAAAELRAVEAGLALGFVAVPLSAPTHTAVPIDANPWADLDTPPLFPAEDESDDPVPHAAPVRRRPRVLALVASLLAFTAGVLVLGQVVIRIRNKDGSETEIKVPKDATVTVMKDGKEVAQIKSGSSKAILPPGDVPATGDRKAVAWVLSVGGLVIVDINGEQK